MKLKLNKRERAYVARQTHYDGGPCLDCGGTKRYATNGHCVACAIADNRLRRNKLRQLRDEAGAKA